MRRALLLLVFLAGCCVTEETRQLAQGVYLYQMKQEITVRALLNGTVLGDDEASVIVAECEALTRATHALCEILGEPTQTLEVGP